MKSAIDELHERNRKTKRQWPAMLRRLDLLFKDAEPVHGIRYGVVIDGPVTVEEFIRILMIQYHERCGWITVRNDGPDPTPDDSPAAYYDHGEATVRFDKDLLDRIVVSADAVGGSWGLNWELDLGGCWHA